MWVNGRPKRPRKQADSAESIAPSIPQDWEEAASSSDKLTISYQKRRFNAHFSQKRRGETVKDRQVSDVCKLPSRAEPGSGFVRSALARRLRLQSSPASSPRVRSTLGVRSLGTCTQTPSAKFSGKLPSRAKHARCPFARLTRTDFVRTLHEHKRLLENLTVFRSLSCSYNAFQASASTLAYRSYQILLSEPSTYLIL